MSKILKKIIILSMFFIIIFNINLPIICHAGDIDVDAQLDESGVESIWTEATAGDVIDGIVGLLSWPTRAITGAIGISAQTIITQLCGLSGDGVVLTAEDIIFSGSSRNTVNLININFFDFSENGASDSVVKTFRQGVAKWYYVLRNISIVVSLAVLIYIGIRMAISSVASDKAMYKKMLTDWIVGFAILIFLHYIIVLILNLNNELVELIYSVKEDSSSIMSDYTYALMIEIFNPSFVKGWGSLVIYVILMGTTIALFIMYMKRLFTVGFLIVISPLITVTYSIDKLGDGKSQALDTWMKEFIYNVLIQPFHCIIYMVFVSTAIDTLNTHKSISNLLFAILAILFIFKAEDIVKTIFGFGKASSIGGIAAAGAIAATGLNKIASAGSNTAKQTAQIAKSSKSGGIQRKQISSSNLGKDNKGNNPSLSSTNKSNNNTFLGNSINSYNAGNNSLINNDNSDTKRKSAFSRAISDYIDEKKAGWNEIKADPKSAILNQAKQIPLKQLDAAMKLTPKLFAGGLIAGATGNGMSGVITGYAVKGGKFTRKISSLAQEDIGNLKMNDQDKKLAAAYEKYRIANNDLSDDELYNKTADLLDSDIEMLTNKDEINLAKQLQNMKSSYEAKGYGDKDADVRVMDKIENIQAGNIKNSVSIQLDAIENATQNLKTAPSGHNHYSDNDILNLSKDIIKDIDTKGKNYNNSNEFKNILSKNEKELANEIYKSKKVLDALGENDKSSINQEIELAIRKGLNKSNNKS